MARVKDPAIHALLVERAARMLRNREPITLRTLVSGTGVSTMAVYTYFDGMDGLWKAVRQEGFTRLSRVLNTVSLSDDPVRDFVALGSAYISNALANPDLYRVMFDHTIELDDPAAADATLGCLIHAAERARSAGRFAQSVIASELATQCWVVGHGLASLIAIGPLDQESLNYGAGLLTAILISAGDDPDQCRRSVQDGWYAYLSPESSV